MTSIRHTRLFLLESKIDEALDEDPEWSRTVGNRQCCPGCARRRLGLYPAPLEAVVHMRQRASSSISGNSCVHIVRRDLYELLLPHMPGLIAGEVRFVDGRVQPDSVTVHTPPGAEVLMRGGHGSYERGAYGICRACGRRKATRGLITKPWHVVRSEIPQGELFYSVGWFLLTEQLASQLSFKDFLDLRLLPVAVFDQPIEPVPEFGEAEPP